MTRRRLNVYLEHAHLKRLNDLAAQRGLSKSSIVAAALSSFLSGDTADHREAAVARRLDQLTRQFDRLERDQNILIETLALFIRYSLSVSLPVPEEHQEAARAQGRVRFRQFVDQLARHLQRGNSLVKEVHDEVFPESRRFFGQTESATTTGEST